MKGETITYVAVFEPLSGLPVLGAEIITLFANTERYTVRNAITGARFTKEVQKFDQYPSELDVKVDFDANGVFTL